MTKVTLEYAQNYNGRFHGWVDAGVFPDRETAVACARAHGCVEEGDDFLVSPFAPINFFTANVQEN